MPVDVVMEEEGTGAVVTCSGIVTLAEVEQANQEILRRMDGLRYQLVDLTHAERFDLNTEDIRRLAQTNRLASQEVEGLFVALAAPTDLAFGLSRMWESMVSGARIEARVLRSVDEAREAIREALVSRE
jgi:hypothetical protein